MNRTTAELLGRVDATLAAVDRRLDGHLRAPTLGEVGRVELVGEGIAQVSGLPHVRAEEIVRLGPSTDEAPSTPQSDARSSVVLPACSSALPWRCRSRPG